MENKEFFWESGLSTENEEFTMHSMSDLNEWIDNLNETADVTLEKIKLSECAPWFYDSQKGEIRNSDSTFFQITGICQEENGKILLEQPIILQNEIGFLGILCRKISGVWHYLMQAKIEPGNVNVVQISPTIQATKSNFEKKHGGKVPRFLKYFLNMDSRDILVDQLQSEQSSRFLGKRNRNVILMVAEEIEEPDNYRWMTLRQIKELMKRENLINMDTRTVLSCIPYVLLGQDGDVPFKNKPYFCRSAWNLNRKTIVELYKYMNDYKMFHQLKSHKVPLHLLKCWKMEEDRIVCRTDSDFQVIFCDINICGREVQHWRQPLLEATGRALFGLFCCDTDGILEFLIKPQAEVGCMDGIELGPTVQMESGRNTDNKVTELFLDKLQRKEGIVADIVLSEEGGRFYQEQNRNAIIMIDKQEIASLPEGYVWSDYGTLNMLTQVNNCLNIQLRNLLSLLEI